MTRKNAYWVVYVGRKPGIYTTWKEAQYQVDGYPNNKHERFKLFDEAQEACVNFMKIANTERTLDEAEPSMKPVLMLLLQQRRWKINSWWSARLMFDPWSSL